MVFDPAKTETEDKPWQNKSASLPVISEPLPQKVEIVLADQLYVNHTGLPPMLRNRILRLASFANPEFYQAQRMRLSTWNKPHILYCSEYFNEYIGLLVGCLDGLITILDHYKTKPELQNKQNKGQPASFERVVRKCPAYYRLGLSATVIRKDGQHPIVMMNLGEVRYSARSTAPLFTQKVFPRFTGFSLPAELHTKENAEPAIQDIFKSVYLNEDRNKMIVKDILAAYSEGRECLVLSERLEHLDILRDLLQEHVTSVFVLKGGLGKKQLKAIMTEINDIDPQKKKIILSTGKYLGEGFDLPSFDTLFLVFPFSWKGMLTQYTGRLNRESFGKKEIHVYDYVDDQVAVLAKMYRRRLSGYKGLGFAAG